MVIGDSLLITNHKSLITQKVRGLAAPYVTHFEYKSNCTLLVVDVHSDFKTKAYVVVCWCLPLHDGSPV